jgi:hypothetical protein
METADLLGLGIGTKETASLKPAKVKIVNVTIKDKTKEGKEMKVPLAEINVKHPEKDETIPMTKIKLERNGKLEVVATWVQTDEEDGVQKIVKSSALAYLMNFLGVSALADIYGKEIEAIEQSKEDAYLCLKAY